MKKITSLLFTILALNGFAQQKSTGTVMLGTTMTANLTLDSETAIATLTFSGPDDKWFGLQFGEFTSGMVNGSDMIYYNGSTVIDAKIAGFGTPSIDSPSNINWTLVDNQNDTPATGLRTIVCTRPFIADSDDYTFNFSNTTINFAWATSSSNGNYNLSGGHGGNRGRGFNKSLTTLGTEDFSLNASQIYPNPSNGAFLIKTKTSLEKVNVYTQTGAFVKTIDVNNGLDTEVNVTGLSTGIYLLELINASSKGWKKVIVK